MIVTRALLLVIAMVSVNPAFADRARYAGKQDLTAQSGVLAVRHRHDWSKVADQLRLSVENPFGVEADVSSLEFFIGGASTARVPSPPLTYLHVTPDSRYVIGLSRIKAMNEVQLVVFDQDAKLLLHRHISVQVFRVPMEEYRKLRVTHAEAFAAWDNYSRLTRTPYSWRQGDTVYLDLWVHMNEPAGSRLFGALIPDLRPSPYSPNFHGSVTNAIYWYHQDAPEPRIVENAGQPELIKLRDPEGIEMSIPFQLTPPPP